MADTFREWDGGVDDALEGMIPMVWAQPPCFWPCRLKLSLKHAAKWQTEGRKKESC